MNALDTHDTPRFATDALSGAAPVALGMAVALPVMPVVWAGDELRLTGTTGEESRTPMPWGMLDDHSGTIALHRELLGLRAGPAGLAGRGMRWLHAGEEVLVWVREGIESSVLRVAARRFHDVVLPEELRRSPRGSSATAASPPSATAASGSPARSRRSPPGRCQACTCRRRTGKRSSPSASSSSTIASQDAALAHGEPAAPTLTAAWSKDALRED